jgi:hypothetical protein
MARRPAGGWDRAPGWGQAFPGWDPLPDPSPLPFRAARSLGRWWWPTTAVVAFLAVVGYALAHDDPAHAGISDRGLVAVTAAAVVLVVLTRRRAYGPRELARTLAEYATVAVLVAALVALHPANEPAKPARSGARPPLVEAPARDRAEAPARPPASAPTRRPDRPPERPGDRAPTLVDRVAGAWAWLADLWRRADQQASRPAPTDRPSDRSER